MHLNLSTTYHPQTDRQTEWVNQILEQYLHVYCSYQQDDWVNYLGLAEFQYNNTFHDATQTSPFFANYGFHPSFSPIPGRIHNPATSKLTSHLNSIRDELHAELEMAQDTTKRYYNSKCSQAPLFRPGDFMMVLHQNIQSTRPSGKLDFWKIGPFKILHEVGKNAYHLLLPPSFSRLHLVFNVNLLKQYMDPTQYAGCLNIAHPTMDPQLMLSSENPLKIRKLLDVRKIGWRFEYLVEQLDKPISETSWFLLSDILNSYDETLESFH